MTQKIFDSRIEKRDYLVGFANGYTLSMKDKHALERFDPDDKSPFAEGLRDGFGAHEQDWAAESSLALNEVVKPASRKPPRRFKPTFPGGRMA